MISIIIPIYNVVSYLQFCLDSILSQSYTDYEVIMIDDGSTDGSSLICDQVCSKDKRFRVIHKSNEGVSIARNVGISNCKGDWIIFCDADDYFTGNALESLSINAQSFVCDCILASTFVTNGSKTKEYHKYVNNISHNPIRDSNHPALWGYMFKSSIIKDNSLHFVSGLAFSEDRVFITSYMIYAKSILLSEDFVYVYRRNDKSVCSVTNGLRKAEHQFWAANELKKISHKVECKYYKSLISKQESLLIRFGVEAYVSGEVSWKSYKLFQESYLKYYSGKTSLICRFFYSLFTFYRRKLFTLKGNPLNLQ